MLFPFSLEGAARIWLEKEPPRSIFTWDDLVLKFTNQFFPPSKTTNLRNEITNFQQRFDESFSEAWDRFKDLLRACPHHGFSELHQLDTFYNALNSKDQYSLNFAAGGNFLDKMPRECLAIIESKSKVCYLHNKPVVAKVSTNTSTSGISPDVAEFKDMVKALLFDKKSQNQSPAIVKAVEENYVTCGGAHSYSYQAPAYQAPAYQALAPQAQGVLKEDFLAYVKANDAVMRNMQTQGQNMQNQLTNLTELITKFVNSNNASTSSSGTLPRNTIANPRSDLKAITTRSELADRSISRPVGVAEDVYVQVELADRSISRPVGVAEDVYVQVEVELKDLPPHLEYAFLEEDFEPAVQHQRRVNPKIHDVIKQEVMKLLEAGLIYPISDSPWVSLVHCVPKKGGFTVVCTHKILMEEDFEPAVQHQRRVNPKIHDVIKQEVIKLLEAGLIYPISDSPWVSLVHCVPKKGGFTVVENEDNELILTRLVTGWRVCIDYCKLNEATRKDHFPLPFMDQMLERLAGNQYYCFLDGFSSYFQILIDPKDQEKTTFTAHMERLLIAACLLGYAMLQARFKGA
nr:reverse transcriptase domain-containing protein [Tanacetum cinerariifolium]